MMKRLVGAAVFAVGTAAFATTAVSPVSAQSAQANQRRDAVVIPFSAPATQTGVAAGTATGTFSITEFVRRNGQLFAVGTIAATIPDGNGVRSIVTRAAVPVTTINTVPAATGTAAAAQAVSCGILHLELGPLDLDLLGLVVHLDRVVLDISAEPGAGNLLGNLLCAIAGLLDGNPLSQILGQLVNLLNQLLGAL